jgi:hypothetical protein
MAQNKIWSDPTLEPKRQFRWIFSFGSASGRLPSYLCKSVNKPQWKIEEASHEFLNHTFYFPGKVTWEKITVTIVDPLDLDAADALEDVLRKSGYLSPDRLDINLNPDQLTTVSKALSAGPNGALGEAYLRQIDASGVIREQWTLKNAWITDVNFGKLDYASDDLVEIEIGIRYDWAFQDSYNANGGIIPD